MGFGMMSRGPMMGGMRGDWMWGTGTAPAWMVALSVVMPLLFPLVILGGGYLLCRALSASETGSDTALEALRTAYTRGDLSQEEYEQRRETLDRDGQAGSTHPAGTSPKTT